jgi:hypothetical protein
MFTNTNIIVGYILDFLTQNKIWVFITIITTLICNPIEKSIEDTEYSDIIYREVYLLGGDVCANYNCNSRIYTVFGPTHWRYDTPCVCIVFHRVLLHLNGYEEYIRAT